MPSTQVLDLSPSYDEGWSNFGRGFANSIGENYTNRRDEDILGGLENYYTEQDAVKRLDLLDKAKGLSPQRKKQERENLFERANLIQEQARIDREIKKAEGQEKINFIDKYYGQPMKEAATALIEARKDPFSKDALPQLQANYDARRKAWDQALRKHAPEGFFPAIEDEAEAEPNAPQENAAPQAQAIQGQRAPIERAAPENVQAFVNAVKNSPDIPATEKPKLIEEYIREANPDEVPAKIERLVREAVTGRSNLPPKPEEIKQLVEKDRKQKEKLRKEEPRLKARIKNLSSPKTEYTPGGADAAIGKIMEVYGVPEDQAISDLLMSVDFEYIPQDEQMAVYEYWKQWMDTERQAVAATIDQLKKMNHKRWFDSRHQKGAK